MTKEEIMEAIKAWREENEERAAFVLLMDEECGLSQAVTGKGINIMAAIAVAARDERTRELIEEALKFGKFYSCIKEQINEEVERKLKEAKEKGEGD